MGRHIQAIVASDTAAKELCARYPLLTRRDTRTGLTILPITGEFYDSIDFRGMHTCYPHFLYLNEGFNELLREVSLSGDLAYIETDYFGGLGGQGAAAYAKGEVRMPPTWSEHGAINRALRHLGLKWSIFGDQFKRLGLEEYRDTEDILGNS